MAGHHGSLTDASAFKRWFGDSKVVDEDGEPLVVYHGTHAVFDEFDPSRGVGGGSWFTSSAEEAGRYTYGDGAVLVPVYLKIERPMILRSQRVEPGAAARRAKASKNHDGLVYIRPDGVNYVVFDPRQVKSADSNTGAFDPGNPDIRANARKPGSLSAADVRLLAEELETGRGRLAQLAEQHPRLREESRRVLAEMCGMETLPLFRQIQLRSDQSVRPETVTSLTASPEYALTLADEAPGVVMTSTEFIRLTPAVLRYDVPVDRVLLYVPVAIEAAVREQVSALRKTKVRARGGSRMSGQEIADEVLRRGEHEVVANVEGLHAEVVTFENREDIALARDWLRGTVRTGEDAVRQKKEEGRLFVDFRGGRFVASAEKETAHWDALFQKLSDVFRARCEEP